MDEVMDDKDQWELAVWLMDKELGEMGLVCHCDGCGDSDE